MCGDGMKRVGGKCVFVSCECLYSVVPRTGGGGGGGNSHSS